MYPSLIEIGSKTAEKNCTNKQTDKQTEKQTDRHYENDGHLAVNRKFQWCLPSISNTTPLYLGGPFFRGHAVVIIMSSPP